jgi:hypothetical protein
LIEACQVYGLGFRYRPGKKYLGNCQAIQTSATKRVQRGTNRPSGKRYRKRPKEAAPRKWRKEVGVSHAGCRERLHGEHEGRRPEGEHLYALVDLQRIYVLLRGSVNSGKRRPRSSIIVGEALALNARPNGC